MRKVLKDIVVRVEGDKVVVVMDCDRLELGMADAQTLSFDLAEAVRDLRRLR